MSDPFTIDPAIRACLVRMLDSLDQALVAEDVEAADYAATLKYLRFKIGEDLYDLYAIHAEGAPPESSSKAARRRIPT